MRSMVNGWVNELPIYQPGKSGRKTEGVGGASSVHIKLSSNENPFGGAERLNELLNVVRCIDIGRYPEDTSYELRLELARQLGVEVGNILVGSGSSDILSMICKAYLAVGREARISSFTFALYKVVSSVAGASVKVVPSIDYAHDLQGLSEIHNNETKVIFIDNPCNPTGTVIPLEKIKGFLKRVNGRSLVVIDEAYIEYLPNSLSETAIQLINEHPNVVVVRTFSKAYGLAGLRLGYCVANEETINLLNKVRSPFNIGTLGALLGLAALSDQAFVQKSVDTNFEERKKLEGLAAKNGILAAPSAANFVFLKLNQKAEKIRAALEQRNIITREFPEYPGYMRVTVGKREENAVLLDALNSALA